MKLLWLCNTQPGLVRASLTGKPVGQINWVDHVLSDLSSLEDIRLLCPGDGREGKLTDRCSFATFREKEPYRYLPELETFFGQQIRAMAPDVIHIWGTEYGHTLAMANAAEAAGMLDRTAVSIQGLCSICALTYSQGVPLAWQYRSSFRDLIRRDNLRQQQKKFARRGVLEQAALKKLRHVIGRTQWDRACTGRIHPERIYHFCRETLRPAFYQDSWQPSGCLRHRIFASSCAYPLKGFHILLESVAALKEKYPDVTLAVPGRPFLAENLSQRLRQTGYEQYLSHLVKQYHLEDRVTVLGNLTAEQMKAEYLKANVFVMPSSVENSPNSLAEAMLLGVPCVAACVGGVQDLLTDKQEGYLYPSTEGYMLTHYLDQVFSHPAQAAAMGAAARAHAQLTHDPEANLQQLLTIYRTLSGGREGTC